VGHQADALDDVADPAAQLHRVLAHDVLAVDEDAPRARLDEPVDHSHRGGLAAARGPDQDDRLALADIHREVVDRGAPSLVEAL
jgi:hypothetical protein